jgi:DNA gyrase subunit B
MSIARGGESEKIQGDDLIRILRNLSGHARIIEYLDRISLWEDLVHFLLENEVSSADQFVDQEFVENLKELMSKKNLILGNIRPCRWKPSCYEFDAAIKDKAHIVKTIGPEIPLIPEYRTAMGLYPQVKEFFNTPFVIETSTQQFPVENWREMLELIRRESFKGYYLQRYKGLGEMNPEQLWETTMNPEKRTLLQVSIEDAEKADDIFTTLMGDKVEPRREFIQNHALEATSLDI